MKHIEDMAISELLKQARKAQGLTIKSIAEDICIQTGFLRAIEAGAYDQLPAKTFAIGFVRAYAKALGQDADAIVAAFKSECGMDKPLDPIADSPPTKKTLRKYPAWLSPMVGLVGASVCWMALGGGLGGAAFVTAVGSEGSADQAQLAAIQSSLFEDSISAGSIRQPDKALVVSVKGADKIAYASPSLFSPAAYAESFDTARSGQSKILLQAVEDSWVRIARPNGTEIWSGILREGQDYRPNEGGRILLTTSNAGGLILTQGMNSAERLGGRGHILADYALGDGEQLAE